jgi:hypothetical protein
MSHPNQPITSNAQQPINSQALPIPPFFENAGKITKIVVGVLLGIVAIGSLGIGVTMTPFAPEIGGSALAFAAALFGAAGYLIFSGVSSPAPDLSSRNIVSC